MPSSVLGRGGEPARARLLVGPVKLIVRRGPALGAFVEEWWALYAEPNLERSTLAVYRWAWEHHARPRLGGLRLRDVTPLTIARFRAELEASGVGAETIRKTLRCSRASSSAPSSGSCSRPTRSGPRASRRWDARGPCRPSARRSSRRCGRICCARGRSRDATLVVLLAYAGLRPGEALGLEWRHVRERTLVVEQAVSRRSRQGTEEPATSASGPAAGAAARRPRACARGSGSSDRPTRRRLLARDGLAQLAPPRVPPGSRARGTSGARPYDLRHAFASLLIAEGRLSIVEIAAQLGHNPTVCLDIYGHEMAERAGAEGLSAENRIWAARREADRCSA